MTVVEGDDLIIAPDKRQETQERRGKAHLQDRRWLAIDGACHALRVDGLAVVAATPIHDDETASLARLILSCHVAGTLGLETIRQPRNLEPSP